MFGPWLEIFTFLKSLIPSSPKAWKWKRPSLNYITLHYSYIITMTIMSSGIIYGQHNMAYIDALFFASGASTQSGLNTIDVNNIKLYQQVVLMLVSSVTNPIFINTFVVFVRLYWFEKRFQNVIIEARKWRESRIMTRTKSEAKAELGLENMERRAASHKVAFGRSTSQAVDDAEEEEEEEEKHASKESTEPRSGSDSSVKTDGDANGKVPELGPKRRTTAPASFHRDITFADEVKPSRRRDSKRSDSSSTRMPEPRSTDQHIAFLERQRDVEEDKDDTLYIPSPRDFDRGAVPERKASRAPPSSAGIGAPLDKVTSTETFPRVDKHNGHDNERQGLGNPLINVGHSVLSQFRSIGRNRSQSRATSNGEDAPPDLRHRGRTNTIRSFLRSQTAIEEEEPFPYLSYQPTIGRNSQFVNLTEEQREELGGIEYRALKALAAILCGYFVGFHVLGLLSFLPWIVRSHYQTMLNNEGISPAWWGVFTPASCFNDLGFTLTPDSMSSFNYAVWPLLMGSFLIIIGNTGFPCMLRFMIWVFSKVVRKSTGLYEELRFLLDHPRRCFILLFPGDATWWLFWILFLLNGIDLIFFIILDLHDEVVSSLPAGIRVLNGWFQAASTRTAGFSVVNIANLHPAIQVSYLIMMYISVFPIAISVRRTNVYEEKSLGLYGGEEEDPGKQSFVGAHLRRQLSFDLWYVFLGLFFISIIEGTRLGDNNQYAFTIFAVLFEIVSAYGTVGLSFGYPGINASFSAEFHTLSKLIIIAMQIRGRHRGLPYALDKAILLPSESLHQKEQEDAALRDAQRARTRSRRKSSVATIPEANFGGMGLAEQGRTSTGVSRRDDSSRGGLTKLISSALSAGPTIAKRD